MMWVYQPYGELSVPGTFAEADLHRDMESWAHFDSARGERGQRNVLRVALCPLVLLTAHYMCYIMH